MAREAERTDMDMAEDRPQGAFQWNKGGWFGAQLGGTCWLLIMGVLIAVKDPIAGLVILACFAASNLYGLSLWKRREELPAYPSIQKLVVVEGLSALVAVAFVHLRDAMRYLPEDSQVSPLAMYGALLVFPFLMVMFHVQERETRKAT